MAKNFDWLETGTNKSNEFWRTWWAPDCYQTDAMLDRREEASRSIMTVTLTPKRKELSSSCECKPIIADYLRCLRRVKGTNDQECRLMAKAYLQCRMDHNLMAPDEFRNLGFADDEKAVAIPKHAGGATSNRTRDDGKKIF